MRILAALVLAGLAVFGGAGPVSAHDQLLSTSPGDGTTVARMPHEVSLTFSDVVLAAGGEANEIKVMDASCTVLNDGPLQVQDNVVSQPVTADATGPVQVLWRVVSKDGHPVSGEFTFTVGGGGPAPTPTCATAAASAGPSATASSPLPWIIGGGIGLLVIAGVVGLLATRSRRVDDQ